MAIWGSSRLSPHQDQDGQTSSVGGHSLLIVKWFPGNFCPAPRPTEFGRSYCFRLWHPAPICKAVAQLAAQGRIVVHARDTVAAAEIVARNASGFHLAPWIRTSAAYNIQMTLRLKGC